MEHQTNALTRIAASTWGATFRKSRLVYAAVVRPALAYGTPIWFSPEGKEATKPSLIRPLEVISVANRPTDLDRPLQSVGLGLCRMPVCRSRSVCG
jgi:hypothetical protein